MSGKSEFVDYEPLKKSQLGQTPEEEYGLRRSVSRDTQTVEASGLSNERELLERDENLRDRYPQISVSGPIFPHKKALKNGHAVSFIGLFIFTTFVFVRPYELSPAMAWLSKGALITAIATLLVYVPTQLGLENRISLRSREVNLVLLLSLLCLVSVPFALDPSRAWNAFVEYSKVVVMFVVMVNVVRTEKRLKVLLLLIMAVSVVLSVAAINDYHAGNLLLGGKRIAGIIGGLFDNPNDLALHLVTFFPITIGLALGARQLSIRLIYLTAALCVLGGIVVTFSRGGFLGLIFVFGTLVWRLGRKNRSLVLLATIILMMLFLVLTPGAYRERLSTTDDGSTTARTGELKRSVFLAARHPVFGVGMDNFVLFSNTEHATHNSYTQVASEVGLTAGVVYVLFLVAALKRVRLIPNPGDCDKRNRALPYLAVGLQASLIGYLVTSFFASVAYLWYAYYLVGYAICLQRLHEHTMSDATL